MLGPVSYADLLPDVSDLRASLKGHGLSNAQLRDVLTTVGWYLREHAEFHQNEYERIGEKRDLGASEEFELQASNMFFFASRQFPE